MKIRLVAGSLAAIALLGVPGCHHGAKPAPSVSQSAETARKPHVKPGPLTAEQWRQAHPNEAGLVPIIDYHNIATGTPAAVRVGLFRSPDQFRHDLERLYTLGYLPVGIGEYLDNRIDIPYGKSPVILTFDDALPSQFSYLPDGSVDPNCAVGILQAFHQKHADWALKGVFFVIPGSRGGFGRPEDLPKKLQALVSMGFELGNGTMSRSNLKRLTDERVQWEIGTCASEIHKMVPNARVDVLAVPLGLAPRNKKLEKDGLSDGYRYHNRAVLTLGAKPARAPIAKKFDPLRIPRIQAVEGTSGINFFLDQLKSGSGRYISDGDVDVTTVPRILEPKISPARLNGSALRTYED